MPSRRHRRHSAKNAPPRRVWLLVAGQLAVAAALTWYIWDLPALDTPVRIPWLVMIPLVYLAELTVVHLQFGRDAHSFSMSEVPLVIGLFFTDPLGLVAAQLIGNALALSINRRQAPVKLGFNLSQFTIQAALAVIVFRAVLGDRDPEGVFGWIGILLALGLAVVVANALINLAIHLAGGSIERSERLKVLKLGGVAALMNASLGLVAVTVMWTRPWAAWVAAVPPVVLYLAYRSYVVQEREHKLLQGLYEATKVLHGSHRFDKIAQAAIAHACSMFEAERVEILVLPGDVEDGGYHASGGPGEPETTVQPVNGKVARRLWTGSYRSGEPGLIRGDTGRRWQAGRPSYDGMVAPIEGRDGILGAVVVTEPLGDVRTFTARDLRFLVALAGQVGVSLETGRLEDSLAQVTRLKEDLRHQATHDSLTGLANRALLEEHLQEAIEDTSDGGTLAALILLDLDDFKAVNDSLGHQAGDELLVAVAKRLKSCCRPHDTVARFGGDEFALLLQGLTRPEDAARVAERIKAALGRPFLISGRSVTSGASSGIALVQPGQDAETLVRLADEAMYAAKRQRKGTFDRT